MSRHVADPIEKLSPSIFYLPCLGRDLVADPLPEEVYFLNPGLPLPATRAENARLWTPEGLPYGSAAAAGCLRDLLAEGELLGHDLLLTAGGGAAVETPLFSRSFPLDASENSALQTFARTGEYAPEPQNGRDAALSREAAREQAQKLLLLYAHLESSILAARALAGEISRGEDALRDILRADGQDGDMEAVAPGADADILWAGGELLEQSLARWREVLRAWLVLLPPEAAFYTANMAALPGLDEKKARPLPPEEAARLFPASVNAGWSFTFVIPDESCAETRLISGQNPAGK